MKLPWDTEEKDRKIERLEEEVERLEEEKDRLENQLEAEKGRRKEHSRKKQEAEEQLNRLKDKLRNLEGQKESEEEEEQEIRIAYRDLSFSEFESLISKLESIESPEEELVSAYSSEGVSEIERKLKNSVDSKIFSRLRRIDSFAAFIDEHLGTFIVRCNAPLNSEVAVGESFKLSQLKGFIEEEKVFVTVSAGETKVYKEQSGDYELLERVSSRVNHKHSQGGFSQGRFERKRDEQIERHLDQVQEELDELSEELDVYLLGDKRLCKELRGERLGGFDPNKPALSQFYSPRLGRL